MREGKDIIKVSSYLYLHELYEGKKNRKNKFKIEWNSFSSIKCGSNPSPPLAISEGNCAFQQKDKKMSNDHFWLKKTSDQGKYTLIPFNPESEYIKKLNSKKLEN